MSVAVRTSFYRYILSTFDILIPGKDPIDVSDRVTSMFIEKNFDDDMFPIFGVGLNLNFINYYDIITNKTTVTFRVKFDRYEFDKYNDTDQVKYKENVFDTIFGLYIDDDSEFLDKGLYEQAKSELNITEDERLQHYEFYLFKEDDLQSSKTIINSILSRCTLTDGVAYLLSSSGAKKVLMSPLDNKTVYNEMLIPPIPVWQSIQYLEEQYGFYKYGALYFYDHDKTYFIDRGPECTAWTTGEIKDVLMSCAESTDSENINVPGTYRNIQENTYELKMLMKNISMRTTTIQEDQIGATDISVINPTNGSVVDIHPNVDVRVGNKKYIVNNYNNQYMNNMLEYEKYQNNHILSVQLSDIDVSCLSPNKRFNFVFEDKAVNTVHGGRYRLSSSFLTFKRLSEAEFSVSASAEFKKSK